VTTINSTSSIVPTDWPLHKKIVEATEVLTITELFQYLIFQDMLINGDIITDGELVIL